MADTVTLPGGLEVERTYALNPFVAGLAKQGVPNSTGGGGARIPAEKKNVIQAAAEAVGEVVKPKAKRGPKPKVSE